MDHGQRGLDQHALPTTTRLTRMSNIDLEKTQDGVHWNSEQRGDFLCTGGEQHQFDIAKTAATAWPLVVHLHGNGGGALYKSSKKNIKSVGLQFAASRLIVVSPLCKWKWSDTLLEPKLWVVELVRQLSAESWVDSSRVYLTGCSMGGMGTWEIGAAARELFAAISPIAAYHFPVNREYIVERLVETPILALHCTDDSTCPLKGEEQLWSAMVACGNEGLDVQCAKGVGHTDVYRRSYCDTDYLWQWLLRHGADGGQAPRRV